MRHRCHDGAVQGGRDGGDEPGVGIGGDQLDPGQAAGVQAAEQGQPAGLGLGRADVDAEDLAVPVSVDAGRDQDVGVDHPAALADLHRQRVRGQERVRARRPGAGSGSPRRGRRARVAITETCDFDSRVMPRVSTSFSIRRVETPSR